MNVIKCTRRDFLKCSSVIAGTSIAGLALPVRARGKFAGVEAGYYQKLENDRVQCHLCPWRCIVEPGQRGHCEVRENRNGTYYSLVYGQVASLHIDPIEKKPLFHFLPSSNAFSIATAGCNVDCKFCQNWELAQRRPEELDSQPFTPGEIVNYALKYKSESIAFTYNEPTVFAEFISDVGEIARKAGVRCVVISNGFINEEPLRDICRTIDAYKIDLKGFTEEYYTDVVGGRLAPVLETLVRLKSMGIWTELVYLTVPTLNDKEDDIRRMTRWIVNELGADVPLHFSRFYPKYRLLSLPPTPVSTLETLRKVAMDGGLNYVYLGNVPGHEGENTYCPGCGKCLITRTGYVIYENHIQDGKCRFCGRVIAGVWGTRNGGR